MKFLRSAANRFVIGVTHVRNDRYTVPANDRRYSRELALVGRVTVSHGKVLAFLWLL
jgi:hypothetical protein